MKLKLKKKHKLGALSCGSLFLYNGTIALKTEYSTDGSPDVYIVGSGEYFWGGTLDRKIRDNLEVIELEIK